MNATWTTGLIGIIGTVTGVLIERAARRFGRLHISSEPLRLFIKAVDASGALHLVPPEHATHAEFNFVVRFFNGREEPIAVVTILVEFTVMGRVVSTAQLQSDGQLFSFLNLKPKEAVEMRLSGFIPKEHVKEIARYDVAYLTYSRGGRKRRVRHVLMKHA